MTTLRTVEDDVENTAVKAAAEEYIARKELRSHPAGEEKNGKFMLAQSEIRACCRKWLKRRFHLNAHARSARHVANLFDVNVQDMMAEVTRLKGE